MSRLFGLVLLFGCCGFFVHAVEPAKKGSKWIDLLADKNLKHWKRMPLDGKKLTVKNPWKMDIKKGILICDGVGIKEMFLYNKQRFKDGLYHVEWRFRKVPGEKLGYNSGVYVRSKNGANWMQVQTAMLDKPPQVGDVFGDVPVSGKTIRLLERGRGTKVVKPVGEWNAFDISCKGKTISVKLNGKQVTKFDDCPFPVGFVGVQAELYVIEFKNIKFKPISD